MKYDKQFREELLNFEGHLMARWTDNTSPHSQLHSFAQESLERETPEGTVAALFIYHQLTIEILISIVIFSDFYVQVAAYPAQIIHKPFHRKDVRFSDVMTRLKNGIAFKGKEQIIKSAIEINKLRNEFGHRIVEYWNEVEISDNLKPLGPIFEDLFMRWPNCLNHIREHILRVKEREEIKNLLNIHPTTTAKTS